MTKTLLTLFLREAWTRTALRVRSQVKLALQDWWEWKLLLRRKALTLQIQKHASSSSPRASQTAGGLRPLSIRLSTSAQLFPCVVLSACIHLPSIVVAKLPGMEGTALIYVHEAYSPLNSCSAVRTCKGSHCKKQILMHWTCYKNSQRYSHKRSSWWALSVWEWGLKHKGATESKEVSLEKVPFLCHCFLLDSCILYTDFQSWWSSSLCFLLKLESMHSVALMPLGRNWEINTCLCIADEM